MRPLLPAVAALVLALCGSGSRVESGTPVEAGPGASLPLAPAVALRFASAPDHVRMSAHPVEQIASIFVEPALQFEHADVATSDGLQVRWTVAEREGRFALVRWRNNRGDEGYNAYFGLHLANMHARFANGEEEVRQVLGYSEHTPLPFASEIDAVDGVSARQLSRRYVWRIRLNGDDRQFERRAQVAGFAVAEVNVNGRAYRLPAFELKLSEENQRRPSKREVTQIYVPALGHWATSQGGGKQTRVVSFIVGPEVLARVEASARALASTRP